MLVGARRSDTTLLDRAARVERLLASDRTPAG
jgi:hypothetical protein